MSKTLELSKKFKQEFAVDNKGINVHEIPFLKSISVHVCEGRGMADKKTKVSVFEQLSSISMQAPVITVAKTSNASFKTREGMHLGAKVTLRKANMYAFLDKLIYFSMARIKDFKGINAKSVSESNFHSFTFGISDLHIFPEINHSMQSLKSGCNVCFNFSAKSKKDVLSFCRAINLPFKD